VRVDGLEITVHANQYPESESLREEEDVFLFLSADASTNVFNFTGGPYSAYRIAAGKVTAMTRMTAAERGEEPQSFEAFESRVLYLIQK
jgi:hypothetical protein